MLVKSVNKGILAIITMALVIATLMGGCIATEAREHSIDIFALDTVINMKAFGGRAAKSALDKAVDRIREIEDHMSPTLENSDVFKINQAAGVEPVKVFADTFYVIEKALEYGRLTEGTFDITIGPIVKLWGISTDKARVPDKDEIEDKLTLVDYKKVTLDRDAGTVYLEQKGMAMDLGAIAKGYAADEAARILREAGVKSALLNLGGNIITIGAKPDGASWRIGLQDPRSADTGENHFAIVEVSNATIVSSGDYERFIVEEFKKTGERYHHIFDPKTGYPARSGLMASTIISSSSIDADALSTILFIMGYEKGLEAVQDMAVAEAIGVTQDMKIYTTQGLEGRLIPTNEHYKIMD